MPNVLELDLFHPISLSLLVDRLEMRSGAVSGGTHHAFAGAGEGFCVFNDLAVCARLAQKDFGLKKAIRIKLYTLSILCYLHSIYISKCILYLIV